MSHQPVQWTDLPFRKVMPHQPAQWTDHTFRQLMPHQPAQWTDHTFRPVMLHQPAYFLTTIFCPFVVSSFESFIIVLAIQRSWTIMLSAFFLCLTTAARLRKFLYRVITDKDSTSKYRDAVLGVKLCGRLHSVQVADPLRSLAQFMQICSLVH